MATKLGDITLLKQSGTVLTLNTKDKFVNDDVTFNISAIPATPAFTGGTISANSTIQSRDGNNVVLSETTNNSGIIVQSYYTASTTNVAYASSVNGYVVKSIGDVALSGQSTGGAREGKRYKITEITVPAATSFKVTTNTYGNQLDTSHPLTIINGGFRYVNVYNNVGSYGRVDVTNRGTVNVYPYSTSEGNIYVVGGEPSSGYMGQTIVTDGKWVNTDVASSGTYYGRVYVPGGTYTANTPTVNASGFVTATTTITAGYIPASTPTSSLQLPTQAAKTVTPTESEQTAVDAGKYTTGIVKVGAISSTYVGSEIAQNDSDDLTASGATVTAPAGYYAEDATKTIAEGAYSTYISKHMLSTKPVVTGALSGTITDIGTTTAPSSGIDGTDYWTITPSGSVTTTGMASAKGTASISTAGYIASGTKQTTESKLSITPTVTNGANRYILKGTITNNTSGGTSSGTINAGSQIKIGAGYYDTDTYYTAQTDSGTLTVDTTTNCGTVSVNGYANANITGINIPTPSTGTNTFSVKVPNGESTATFTFNVDTSGNVTITES